MTFHCFQNSSVLAATRLIYCLQAIQNAQNSNKEVEPDGDTSSVSSESISSSSGSQRSEEQLVFREEDKEGTQSYLNFNLYI